MSDDEFEILESKDSTPDLIIKEEEEEKEEEKKEIPDKDHPLAEIIGSFIDYTNDHVKKLKKEGVQIPEINKNLYDDFLKGFLNKAFWHYIPDTGESLGDPKLCLAIGAGGLLLISAPTLVGIVNHYRKPKTKQKPQEEPKSEQTKEDAKPEEQTPGELRREVAKKKITAFG